MRRDPAASGFWSTFARPFKWIGLAVVVIVVAALLLLLVSILWPGSADAAEPHVIVECYGEVER